MVQRKGMAQVLVGNSPNNQKMHLKGGRKLAFWNEAC